MVSKAQTYTPTHTYTQLRIASGSVVGPGITWESEKELSELTLYIVPRYVCITVCVRSHRLLLSVWLDQHDEVRTVKCRL